MALPGIDISVINGALGNNIPTDDGLAGLLLQGPAATGLTLLTPRLITSLAEAESLGIDSDYDTTNTVRVWKHISEFYAEAGAGSRLWIMLVSDAVSMANMVNVSQADYAVKLLNAADGKIRLLGVSRSPASGYTATVTNAIDADVETAITNGHALATQYANSFKPLRIVLEGREYTANAGNLPDLTALDKNRVAVILGDTVSGKGSAIGLALGRLAAIPVQRNIGRVKSGSLSANAWYYGTSTFADHEGSIPAIHDKGFIAVRRYVGKAGYYYTDDPTATGPTDDFRTLANGRVIDKAIVLTYTTYAEEILDEVLIDAQGRIETAKAKYYEAIIESAINNNMTANLEISRVRAFVDAEQNVLSTGKITVELRITPVGYAKDIVINLGFENPANA